MDPELKTFQDNHKTAYLYTHYVSLTQKITETEELLSAHPEMKDLAGDELATLKSERDETLSQMRAILDKEKEEEKISKEIIIEIRAGAGGEEASIFANDLMLMYERYALRRGWRTTLLDESRAELGGYKEVSFSITGNGVYDAFRFESGVHRVQRIPATEKQGRVHTSTASVAVLPVYPKLNVTIAEKDIEISFTRSGGAAGHEMVKKQYVSEIIEARVEEILQKIDAELMKIKRNGLLPAGAIFTGGGSKLPGLIETAKKVLRLPAVLGYPLHVTSVTDKVNDLAFSTAVGLVKWGNTMQGYGYTARPDRGGSMKKMGRMSSQLKKWIKTLIP
jgi:hypothetical protein